MKSSVRIICTVLLTVLYCYTSCVFTKSFTKSDFQDYPVSVQETIISDFSSKLFSHNIQSETSLINTNNFTPVKIKNSITGFWAIIKTTKQIFNIEITQNLTFSQNILINYKKTDLIFPFNYFW
ncbi:MAG: hypothetical protein BGO29_08180 [Bacteroidales bacterium 36-12]|nr:MAG: hypothetical protein BGO29_08180 [Bacteroidales bacterium 36-12]